jgi:hypothetical protein
MLVLQGNDLDKWPALKDADSAKALTFKQERLSAVSAQNTTSGKPRSSYRQASGWTGTGKAGRGSMAKLTYEERKDLPKGDFVFPKTRRYPIEDAAHARDALARSSGKPEHAAVLAAVRKKFPEIEIEK